MFLKATFDYKNFASYKFVGTVHYEKKLTKNIRPTDNLQIYTKYLVNVLKLTNYLVLMFTNLLNISKFLPPRRRKTLPSY